MDRRLLRTGLGFPGRVRPLTGVVPMILLLGLLLAIALAAYLVYALLLPERF